MIQPTFLRATCCAVLMAIAGCAGGPRLSARPDVPVDLVGVWALDKGLSDDAAALVRASLPRLKEQRRARYDMWGNELPEGADPSSLPPGTERGDSRRVSDNRARSRQANDETVYVSRQVNPVWGKIPPFEYVSFFAMPSQRVDIRQESGTVQVGMGGRSRTYAPGDEEPINLTDRFGSRSVRAGWLGNAFVITTTDGKNVQVDDSFKRLRDDRLDRTIVTHITGIKSITIHAIYHRATAAELESGVEQGPPAPVR